MLKQYELRKTVLIVSAWAVEVAILQTKHTYKAIIKNIVSFCAGIFYATKKS